MRIVFTIAKKEIHSFFVSPTGYFVTGGFLFLAQFFFFKFVDSFNSMLLEAAALPYGGGQDGFSLNHWVVEGYFQMLLSLLVFFVPLLTMRSLAEEKRRGTFEFLLTAPITSFEIVLGKFIGVSGVLLVMLVLSAVFPFLLYLVGDPELMPLLAGLGGVLLCALAFCAIGLAISACFSSQITSAVVTIVVLLFICVPGSGAEAAEGGLASLSEYLSPVGHAREMIQGVISVKSSVYFLTLVAAGIWAACRIISTDKLRTA